MSVSRNKRRKQLKKSPKPQKKIQPLPVGGKEINPASPASLAHLQTLYKQIKEDVTREIQAAQLRARIDLATLAQEHSTTRANQVVLQSLLRDLGIIDGEKFQAEFKRYLLEKVGVVRDGEIVGSSVAIDLFNVGAEKVRVGIEEHQGDGPVIMLK